MVPNHLMLAFQTISLLLSLNMILPSHAIRGSTSTTITSLLVPGLRTSTSNKNTGNTNIATIALSSAIQNDFWSSPTVVHDIEVSALVAGASIGWLQIWIYLAKQGIIPPNLSRKIIHSGSAPLFMSLWV